MAWGQRRYAVAQPRRADGVGRDIRRWIRRGIGTQCATTLSHVGVLIAAWRCFSDWAILL